MKDLLLSELQTHCADTQKIGGCSRCEFNTAPCPCRTAPFAWKLDPRTDLLKVPCKVGDKVWYKPPEIDEVWEGVVDSFVITSNCQMAAAVYETVDGRHIVVNHNFSDFGVFVFTDKEAAYLFYSHG